MAAFSAVWSLRAQHRAKLSLILGGMLAGAMAAAAGAGTVPSTYFLHAAARTGGTPTALGLPTTCTITSAKPAMNRAGHVAIRFYDTSRRTDGIAVMAPGDDRTRVVVSMVRPDQFGFQAMISPAIDLSGSTLAMARLDRPGVLELRSVSGDLLASPQITGADEPVRVSLSGDHLAASAGTGLSGASITALSTSGDVFTQRTLAAVPDGPLLFLGPATVDRAGGLTFVATVPTGDAIVRFSATGELHTIAEMASDPSAFVLSPLSDSNEQGQVAVMAQRFDGLWELRRYESDGTFVVLATEGAPFDAPMIAPGTMAQRGPAISESGEVVFVAGAGDGSGSALFAASHAGVRRVLGWGTTMAIGLRTVTLGLGEGAERQVVISDPAINDWGQVSAVVRLRDGTTALVVATPARAPECPADFNRDGAVSADDLADYINAYFAATEGNAGAEFAADFNRDEVVNADDLGDFVNGYFGADCEA